MALANVARKQRGERGSGGDARSQRKAKIEEEW